METTKSTMANEPALMTYGMSTELKDSGLLLQINRLSHEDKKCLIRYIYDTEKTDSEEIEFIESNPPYTMEELNARIDEAEEEMERGEGKTFESMMSEMNKNLLWLK